MSSSIFVSSWLLSPVGITLGSNIATWFDPSLLRINPFSRVRCWIPAFFALITACSTASGVRSQDISTPLNRNVRVAACTFPSSSRQTHSQWYRAVKIQHVKIQFFADRNSETRHVMDWRLSESSTADHGLSWPTSTCHLPSWCRRKQNTVSYA